MQKKLEIHADDERQVSIFTIYTLIKIRSISEWAALSGNPEENQKA
ncbi:hypothetical protein GCM10028895_12390 [Pontibacter rugosus]